ncbi:MAG: AraC family transcriptional regulator [Chryseobacterium sp.]|nr:MAG: AraC family transcriptional regulator [Chryseobacterium sp.]
MNLHITGSENDLRAVAEAIGSIVENDTVIIPKTLGDGQIRSLAFSASMKLIIVECSLKEDITFKRHSPRNEEIVTLGFRNMAYSRSDEDTINRPSPSVIVSRTDFEIEFNYPARTAINLIIIIIKISSLKKMLYADDALISQLRPIFLDGLPFHFEEIMSPKLQDIAMQLQKVDVSDMLQLFYCRIKAEEMIYLFFQALLDRKDISYYALKNEDIKMIYYIRGCLIRDFNETPNIPKLARRACMSESKMKKLFKQVYGKSIYNYFQHFRMLEAAYLIREKDFSIS